MFQLLRDFSTWSFGDAACEGLDLVDVPSTSSMAASIGCGEEILNVFLK